MKAASSLELLLSTYCMVLQPKIPHSELLVCVLFVWTFLVKYTLGSFVKRTV